MGVLRLFLRQLKERSDHGHTIAQHRACMNAEIQQSPDQPTLIQIISPEQTQLLLPIVSTQTREAEGSQQTSTETNSTGTAPIAFDHEVGTEAQQPKVTNVLASTQINSPDVHKNIPYVGPPSHIADNAATKTAKSVCSGLVGILTQWRMGKSKATNKVKPSHPVWKCIGTSMVGTRHSKTRAPCQDAWKYKTLPSGELVIAVADGAGSASLAEEGSALAVAVAVNYLCKAIPIYKPNTPQAWTELISHAFEIARVRLITHAIHQETAVRHYTTTLQIVVVAHEWTVTGIIGDGIAVGLANDTFMNIMIPQHYEYANVTNFITSSAAMRYLDVHVRPGPVEGVAILTDGLLPLSINEQNNLPHPRFFEPLFRFLGASTDEEQATKSLEQFLNSSRVNTHTDDDKTLVLALRMAL